MKCVLLVDDDPDILESLADILGATYEVEVARDGREALGVLARRRVDLIVLDLMMPILDGPGFLAQLRAAGDTTPVILSSAASAIAATARASAAADYVSKPYRIEVLEAKIAKVLGASGLGGASGGSRGSGPTGSGSGGGIKTAPRWPATPARASL
jgi:DNA-binding response OmpR family regulator